jgi:hypothetical protein
MRGTSSRRGVGGLWAVLGGYVGGCGGCVGGHSWAVTFQHSPLAARGVNKKWAVGVWLQSLLSDPGRPRPLWRATAETRVILYLTVTFQHSRLEPSGVKRKLAAGVWLHSLLSDPGRPRPLWRARVITDCNFPACKVCPLVTSSKGDVKQPIPVTKCSFYEGDVKQQVRESRYIFK